MRRLPRLTPLNRNDIDPSSPFCQSRFVPFPAEQTIKKRKYRAHGGTCHARAPAGIPGAARPRTRGRSPRRPWAPGTDRGWREAAHRERHFGLGARCRFAQPRARVTSPQQSAAVAVAAYGTDGGTERAGGSKRSCPDLLAAAPPPPPGGSPGAGAAPVGLSPGRAATAQPAPGALQGAGPRCRALPCRPPCPLPEAGGRWPRRSPAAPRRPNPLRCPRAMNKAEAAAGTGTGARLLCAGLRRRPSPPPPAGGKQRRRERQGELPVSLAPFSRDSRR